MNEDKRKRLFQLMGMTGSKHDGEALNAVRLANRLLGELGISWEEALTGTNGAGRYSADDMQEAARQAYEQGVEDGRRQATRDGQVKPVRIRPSWQTFAREIRDHFFGELNDWEEGFVESFIERGWPSPTEKQKGVFERIADKLDLDCPE